MAAGLRVLLDSSAWINFLRGNPPWTEDFSETFFKSENVIVADLVYVEVVRGANSALEFQALSSKLEEFEQVSVLTTVLAQKAVGHFQLLRSKGITVRGTIDLILATWCIENDIPLMHADRDFFGFEEHLGLKRWAAPQQALTGFL
jgi:predicted nucleic acid-binding protein